MKSCVFCKIVKKEIPSKIKKETEDLIVFPDINPRAPIHLLIVPKKHIKDVIEADGKIWEGIKDMATLLAKELKLNGFRLVHNAGDASAVPHMHVHFLGQVSVTREV